ncbi:hypothetical protein C943_01933 [Mariniradius saccharolyticus AK6]|uniref:Uncharacterized protein n=1 Tax=Mariniradius saccharolyticus AK6 TaxID=1239962 RepID=M7XT20_9BACT|nr:hypothetical protein C943_01933 [Mariniradius saccharolyticus AK6]
MARFHEFALHLDPSGYIVIKEKNVVPVSGEQPGDSQSNSTCTSGYDNIFHRNILGLRTFFAGKSGPGSFIER